TDDAAYVAKEELGDRLSGLDPGASFPLGLVARDLEVQRQSGEVMAEQVVEIAGNAGSLGDPGALSQQLPSRLELGICGSEPFARGGFLREQAGRGARDDLERQVGEGKNDAPVPAPVQPHDRKQARA